MTNNRANNDLITRAKWFSDGATRQVLAALETHAPGATRFVGGCVRDALLGLPSDDVDLATMLTPPEVIAAAERAELRVATPGAAHGVVTIICGQRGFEVTTLRRDVETDGRHAQVAFSTDWAEDAARRDFYCNALYADGGGQVFDPTGQGLADIAARRVRFIGEAPARIREDRLRILRFFRFHAWYGEGEMDRDGLEACRDQIDGLSQLSAERQWKELRRLLEAADLAPTLRSFEAIGGGRALLGEPYNLERALRLIECEAEASLAPQPLRRLAALLDADLSRAAASAGALRLSNAERDRLLRACAAEPRVVSYMSVKETRRAVYTIGAEALVDRAMLGWAGDGAPRRHLQWRALVPLAQTFAPPRFPLTGADVLALGVPPGAHVSAILREVEAWWIDSDFPDDPLSLLERLKVVVQALRP